MILKKSKTILPEDKKEEMKNILLGNNVSREIYKNNINSEQYKIEKKEEPQEDNKQNILGEIKKETKKLFQFVDNVKNIISPATTNNNISNITKKYDISYPRFFINDKNTNSNFTNNLIKTNKNSNFTTNLVNNNDLSNSTSENNSNILSNRNIDQNTIFKPSVALIEKINKKFNTTINKQNINNIMKRPSIPALKVGGMVKEPTVSYLHENEAVVPLKESKEFSQLINYINDETIKNVSKNETNNILKNEKTSSISEMRNYSANRSMTKNNNENNITNNKSNQTQQSTSVNNSSVIVGGNASSPDDLGRATIPSVYGGSSSTSELFMNSSRIPSWRTSIG